MDSGVWLKIYNHKVGWKVKTTHFKRMMSFAVPSGLEIDRSQVRVLCTEDSSLEGFIGSSSTSVSFSLSSKYLRSRGEFWAFKTGSRKANLENSISLKDFIEFVRFVHSLYYGSSHYHAPSKGYGRETEGLVFAWVRQQEQTLGSGFGLRMNLNNRRLDVFGASLLAGGMCPLSLSVMIELFPVLGCGSVLHRSEMLFPLIACHEWLDSFGENGAPPHSKQLSSTCLTVQELELEQELVLLVKSKCRQYP
ncbi:hypothetical protein Tco_1104383 [Tanacetum coccineum]